jgi:hypothetical protein
MCIKFHSLAQQNTISDFIRCFQVKGPVYNYEGVRFRGGLLQCTNLRLTISQLIIPLSIFQFGQCSTSPILFQMLFKCFSNAFQMLFIFSARIESTHTSGTLYLHVAIVLYYNKFKQITTNKDEPDNHSSRTRTNR